MAEIVAIDVIVPGVVPVVDVASVGVQGPPGEQGEPGEPGPPGPQGEVGSIPAGPTGTVLGGGQSAHVQRHPDADLSDRGVNDHHVLHGDGVMVSAGTVAIGATPAQSGALRLGNHRIIKSRNDTNTADVNLLEAWDGVYVGDPAETLILNGGNILMWSEPRL